MCELGVPLTSPTTHAEYPRTIRSILQQVQLTAKMNRELTCAKWCDDVIKQQRESPNQLISMCGREEQNHGNLVQCVWVRLQC